MIEPHPDDPLVTVPPLQPEPPPAPPPRPRVWTLALVLVVLTLGIFGFVVMAMIAVSLGVLAGSGAQAVDPALDRLNAWIDTLPGTLVLTTVSSLWFAGVALVAGWLSPRPLVERLGLARPAISLVAYVLAIVAGAALSESADAFLLWSGIGRGESIDTMLKLFHRVRGWELAASVFVIGGFAGAAEELLFRGYFQTRLVERLGPAAGIVIVSILFGLAHIEAQHAFFASLFGLYAGWLSWRARSIWPAITAHVSINALSTLMSAAGWGMDPGPPSASAPVLVAGLAVFVLAVAGLRRVLPR